MWTPPCAADRQRSNPASRHGPRRTALRPIAGSSLAKRALWLCRYRSSPSPPPSTLRWRGLHLHSSATTCSGSPSASSDSRLPSSSITCTTRVPCTRKKHAVSSRGGGDPANIAQHWRKETSPRSSHSPSERAARRKLLCLQKSWSTSAGAASLKCRYCRHRQHKHTPHKSETI